jgi:hypothetical protein
MEAPHPETFVPLRSAAVRLGVPAAWLRAEADAGRVPFLLASRMFLFNVDAVERALLERTALKTKVTPAVAGNVAPEVLAKSVADIELTVRSRRALRRLNINTVGDLAACTEAELLGCNNFGETSLSEIKHQLGTFGMGLRKLKD